MRTFKKVFALLLAVLLTLPVGMAVHAGGAETSNAGDYSLVTHWDFSGDTDEERLLDKAVEGKADNLTIAAGAAGVTIDGGIATISDGANNYLSASGAEGTDLYSMKNKTVLIKASLEKGTSLTAGFFSKKGVFSYGLSNTSTPNLYYSPNNTVESGTEVIANIGYRIYAVTLDYDENAKETTITLYISDSSNSTSGEEFKEIVSVQTTTAIEGVGDLLVGKRDGDEEKSRNLKTYVDDVKIFDGVLTPEQMGNESYTLVTHWNFEGVGDAVYQDKATAGNTKDKLNEGVGNVTIENGVAAILDGSGTASYMTAKVVKDTDLYSMANKTILIKAKLDKGANTSGFFGKDKAFAYGVQGVTTDSNNKSACLYYNSSVAYETKGTSPIAVDEYRMYALTLKYDDATTMATITLYMSNKEYPTSAEDFEVQLTATVEMPTARIYRESDIYIGKRGADHITKTDRNLNTYVDDIKIFDGVLSSEQMADECRAPVFRGIQIATEGTGVTKAGTFGVRFVGTVGNKNMAELGFKISAVYTGAAEAKDLSQSCTVVYKTITANTQYGIDEYDARTNFNSEYIYTLTVIDIPLELITAAGGYVEFTVTPYSREMGANAEDLGISYKVKITYDADAEEAHDKYVKEIVRV